MIQKERDGTDRTDVLWSLKLTLSSLLQGPVIPPYLLLRTLSFFIKMSAKSIFWQKMWNTPQNILPQQTHQCVTRQWYQERKPSSSFSFCKVLVLTNLIGQEEMRLMKYTFLVFSMGPVHLEGNRPFVITEHKKVESLSCSQKANAYNTIQYKVRQDSKSSSCLFSVVTFLPLKCLFSSSLTFSETHVSKGSLHLKRLQQHFC